MDSLQYKYEKIITPLLLEKYYKINLVQKHIIKSTVINSNSVLDNIINIINLLQIITNKHPKITRAKRSIANFKLRKNMAIGGKITLSGRKIETYEFLKKFIYFILLEYSNNNKINLKNSNINIGINNSLVIFPESYIIRNLLNTKNNNLGLNISINMYNLNYNQIIKTILQGLQIPINSKSNDVEN